MRRLLLIAALAAVAVTPALAVAKKKHSHIPNCSALSRSAIAKLAQTGHLKLEKKVGNLCEFTGKGEHHGHYKTTLDVQVIPYIKSIWQTAKSDAQSTAAKNGSTYGENSKKLFFVTGLITGKGKQQCKKDLGKPGHGQSKFGPVCATEPNATHVGVYGNGTDMRNGLHLMVSAAVTGEEGDVHLSHMLKLVKDVISGKIH